MSVFETVEQARAFLERRGRVSLRGLKCVAIVLLFAGCIALVLVASPAARAQPPVSNEVQKLLASDGAGFDLFGRSAAISGDAVVIGAYLADDSGIDSGSAYPFSVAIATQVPIPEAVAAVLAALLGLTGSQAARQALQGLARGTWLEVYQPWQRRRSQRGRRPRLGGGLSL